MSPFQVYTSTPNGKNNKNIINSKQEFNGDDNFT